MSFAYVGCYTTPDRDGRGTGIEAYRMDAATGAWEHVQSLGDVPNPSFLALDPSGRRLYTVHGGDTYSAVSAFAIDHSNGQISLLNTQPCGGPNPVGLTVSPAAPFLVVANYGGGTIAALPINADGSLGPLSDLVTLVGEPGPHPTEQTKSHPHHISMDPDGRWLIVPDKGFDRVYVFRVDPATGKLIEGDPPSVQSAPGAAPRHAAFHPTSKYLYVINEIDSTLATYAFDAERGALDQRQVISTLPPDFAGRSTTAEIEVAPSGQFVYGSNRGHDSIAIFAVDDADGTLTPVGWEPSGGTTPRFFAIDPSGDFLYAANQGSDTIVTFRVDQHRGTLTRTGQVIETGSPVSIVFA